MMAAKERENTMNIDQLRINAFACLRQARAAADRGDVKLHDDLYARAEILLARYSQSIDLEVKV